MSEGLNRVMLLGNLGADPEVRVTQGGQSIMKLRLATTEKFKDKNGALQERTEWHYCTIFGPRAEALSKYLNKGDRVFVEGSLRTTSFDKDGEKRYRTEVVVNDLIFAGGSRGEQSGKTSGGQTQSRQQKPQPASGGDYDFDDGPGNPDLIPF